MKIFQFGGEFVIENNIRYCGEFPIEINLDAVAPDQESHETACRRSGGVVESGELKEGWLSFKQSIHCAHHSRPASNFMPKTFGRKIYLC